MQLIEEVQVDHMENRRIGCNCSERSGLVQRDTHQYYIARTFQLGKVSQCSDNSLGPSIARVAKFGRSMAASGYLSGLLVSGIVSLVFAAAGSLCSCCGKYSDVEERALSIHNELAALVRHVRSS